MQKEDVKFDPKEEMVKMGYAIFKYGSLMLTKIEDLERAKKKALSFVASMGSEYIEIRDSDNETVTIGYFDGWRFHWTKNKRQAEAWEAFSFVTKPPLWREREKPERTSS